MISIITRTARKLVIVAVLVGSMAGLAALPAHAATPQPAAAAVGAAAQPTVQYSVQCWPGRADWKLTVPTSTAGQTYAYPGGAYDHAAQGWVPTMGGQFQYGTTMGHNTVELGGANRTVLQAGVYWELFVYLWVWQGNGWSGPVLVFADHDGDMGRYRQPYRRT